MKKLEELNSLKYSLTPEKMGELVGGAINTTCTDNGNGFSCGYYHGKKVSADYSISYSGDDVHDNIISETYLFCGDEDVAKRNDRFNICDCNK
ncbi:MAG: hypothetical protein K5882_05815 [Bacteroidales bacterium]|nr:hypothetical protein [Bacteroidales bacterium]